MKTYRIKPLEWKVPQLPKYSLDKYMARIETADAGQAGHYTVREDLHGTVSLRIFFAEFYDEHTLSMASFEDAKIAAEEDWHQRLLPALENAVDYKALLRKYVGHVGDYEGVDFLDQGTMRENGGLTAEEVAIIKEVV